MICSDELRFDTRRIAIIIDVMKDDTHELCRQFFSRQGCPARPRPSDILYIILLHIILSYLSYNTSGKPRPFHFSGFPSRTRRRAEKADVERHQLHSVFQPFVRANLIIIFNLLFVPI